jgi:hypothetical protein
MVRTLGEYRGCQSLYREQSPEVFTSWVAGVISSSETYCGAHPLKMVENGSASPAVSAFRRRHVSESEQRPSYTTWNDRPNG